MKNLTRPILRLNFIRHNSAVIDMQVQRAASETNAKPQCVLIHRSLTKPALTTKTITAFVDYPLERKTTGTVTQVRKLTEAASLLKHHSMSTKINRKISVKVTNTTESPYSTKKKKRTAEFSVATPEQSKFIKASGHGNPQYDSKK